MAERMAHATADSRMRRSRSGRRRPRRRAGVELSRGQAILRGVVLTIGAIVFLFPFYYMFIGSLQTEPDPTVAGAFPNPANLTIENYVAINGRINLVGGLVNSGIFTGGVLLFTVVFGLLAGYSLAILRWRGRGTTFALALLVQVVPFQLLIIPLYVLIARNYGLADNYLGMILPFAINSTAVIISGSTSCSFRGSFSTRHARTAQVSFVCCGALPFRWCARHSSRRSC